MAASGEKWNHFELLESIARGGMGEIFLARDTSLDRKVALKILPEALQKNESVRKRFEQEAKSAAALDHPYICKILEVGEYQGKAYIAMEYVEGVTLQEKLARGPVRLRELLQLGSEITEAVQAAHEKGIVHRDLKTPNIMVTKEGHAKVMDFGIALRLPTAEEEDSQVDTLSHRLSGQGVGSGTVIYMSPEQVRGEPLDARSDIFSLGVVLYEMATGALPFQGATSGLTYDAILNRGANPPRSVNPDVPIELERIVLKALEKDREDRYQSAEELFADLRVLKRDTAEAGQTTGSTPVVRDVPPAKASRGGFRAVLMLAVVGALFGAWWLLAPGEDASSAVRSVAILPFENTQGDPDVDYLSDGIPESLINRLSRLPELDVMARSTTFRYRGQDRDPLEVGKELGVAAVVTGRVMQQGELVNVQAELVEVDTGRQLWGEQFSQEISDLVELQNDITQRITTALRPELTGDAADVLAASSTANAAAYQAYLKGRFLWRKRTSADFEKAIEFFEEAKRADPSYALAYVGLADCYVLLGMQVYGPAPAFPPERAFSRARAAAEEALELDDSLAAAHATLAWIELIADWDLEAAESGFEEAIALDPGYVSAHHWYAIYLSMAGRHDEAFREIERAVAIEPGSPLFNRDMGLVLFQAKRYPEAIEQLERSLELDASFPLARRYLSDALWLGGRREEAVKVAYEDDPALGGLLELVRDGRAAEVAERLGADDEVPFFDRVRYLAIAGEEDRLLSLMEDGLARHEPVMPIVMGHPLLAPFAESPRFIEVRRSFGLS